ncbi:11504_t:CDS:2, partial [Funneliformis caledonium]
PRVPGHPETIRLKELRSRVEVFPGAQPTSFYSKHIQELQNEDYYVCEQSDGTRVLAYITCDSPGKPAYLRDYIMSPYEKMLRKRPDLAIIQPYKEVLFVVNKEMERSYGLEKVLKQIIPSLKHNCDGLIFTSSTSGYSAEKILKWKPPNENSIDLKLSFDFKRHKNNKPRFCLYKWMDVHRYFDNMTLLILFIDNNVD